MKWLVTVKKLDDQERILEQLKSMECEILTVGRPTALGADEEVLSIEGPPNLVHLAEPFSSTMKVYPNSSMRPF